MCTAAGYYETAQGNQALIETLADGSWTAMAAPLTGLDPAANSTDPSSRLDTVACPRRRIVRALGAYSDVNGQWQGLVETLSDWSWTASTLSTARLAIGTNLPFAGMPNGHHSPGVR